MNPLFSEVTRWTPAPGVWSAPASVRIALPNAMKDLEPCLSRLFNHEDLEAGIGEVSFLSEADLKPEGYRIEIGPAGIRVVYRDYAGAFHALGTLSRMRDPKTKAFPCGILEDAPALPVRGFLMDISRDKIPTLSTLKALVDKMAVLKMNHLELYVEGFSLEYPSFPAVAEGETPFTLAEFSELEDYAAKRAVDLVPNMNGFGHMTAWLKRKEFRRLAECPAGFRQWGYHFPPSTLNPLDPRSLALVKRLQDDLLPLSHSANFNINCDEPFELGRGKSRKAVKEKGLGTVYVDYVSRLVEHVNAAGKTALVWGDVLLRHPESLGKLPPGMVFLDWGYDYDYDFASHMEKLAALGVRFLGCPGTSSWCSFASRKRDMFATVGNAVEGAMRFGGEGILLTDWGDMGHLQYLPFSYPGLIYAGLCAWRGKALPEEAVEPLLAQWTGKEASRAILDLAGYSLLENKHVYNATMSFAPVLYADPSEWHPVFVKRAVLRDALRKQALSAEAETALLALCAKAEAQISTARPKDAEASLLLAEIRQTIVYLRIGVLANRHLTGAEGDSRREELLALLEISLAKHPELWVSRNKDGGLGRSLARLLTLKSVIASTK